MRCTKLLSMNRVKSLLVNLVPGRIFISCTLTQVQMVHLQRQQVKKLSNSFKKLILGKVVMYL